MRGKKGLIRQRACFTQDCIKPDVLWDVQHVALMSGSMITIIMIVIISGSTVFLHTASVRHGINEEDFCLGPKQVDELSLGCRLK